MHGLVLVGNPETFKKCKNHLDESLMVQAPEDFSRVSAEGGCSRVCGLVKPCGHLCERRSVTLSCQHICRAC